MNSPDCGNQRTGQPRCAQLTANTWNWSPSTRRTQHAVSAVLPSVGVTWGFRNVARRVSPSGNSLTRPRETPDREAPARPRVTHERTNPTMGTARADATNPLKRIPNFMNSPRREMLFSFGTFRLLGLRVIGSRVWLAWVRNASGREPPNTVGDFLIRHRPARQVSAPVGCSQLWAARDYDRA